MSEEKQGREPEATRRVCANEGCGRPAEKHFCDVCGLEWSLFHREERVARALADQTRR